MLTTTRAVHEVTLIATRAIAQNRFGETCFVTRNAELECVGIRYGSEVFVAAGANCGLTVDGKVMCPSVGGLSQEFAGVSDIVDLSFPCVRTRGWNIYCASDAGLAVLDGVWKALECRLDACCALDSSGRAACWGEHEYDLFGRNDYAFRPLPVPVPGLPNVYARLTSGEKTFFGQTADGEWTSATNRMGLPSPVITGATASTLKLDSPYYCIMGLEEVRFGKKGWICGD